LRICSAAGVDLFADFPQTEMPFEAVAVLTSQSRIFLTSTLNLFCQRLVIFCFLSRACSINVQQRHFNVRFPVFLIAFFSEVVGTVAGFGSSVFFVPLAGLLLGFHEVLALTSILHVFSNAAKLVFFGRHVRLRV
jgi:hypothetical protein